MTSRRSDANGGRTGPGTVGNRPVCRRALESRPVPRPEGASWAAKARSGDAPHRFKAIQRRAGEVVSSVRRRSKSSAPAATRCTSDTESARSRAAPWRPRQITLTPRPAIGNGAGRISGRSRSKTAESPVGRCSRPIQSCSNERGRRKTRSRRTVEITPPACNALRRGKCKNRT